MSDSFKKGDYVAWPWAGGYGHGTVTDVSSQRVEIESKGARIVRNGTADNAAVTISDHNGTQVLKLASELQHTTKDSEK